MIPSLAARPVPATTATGVASPKAHGQDTTSTLIANCNDSDKEEPWTKYHKTNVIRAKVKINGTKYEATTSAILATGTLVAAVFSTNFMILPKVVSSPVVVTFISR